MKFTFIIPIYNAEKYLEKCIESVLNQTYHNYEVILVNDGSKDNSFSIIMKYASKDKRIIVINKQNAGVSSARNCALDVATGDYILFVDADDICNINMLDIIKKNIKNYDMLLFAYEKKYKNKSVCIKENKKNEMKEKIADKIFSNMAYSGYLWNKVFSSKIIKANQIKFNEKYHFCEDMVFISNYLEHVNSVKYINSVLYSYRMRVSSVSNVLIDKKNISILDSYMYLFNYYKDNIFLKNQFMYNYSECFMKFKKIMSAEEVSKFYTSEMDIFVKALPLRKKMKLIIIDKFYVEYIFFRKFKNSMINLYE